MRHRFTIYSIFLDIKKSIFYIKKSIPFLDIRTSFFDLKKGKSRKYQGVFDVKSRVKTWQVRGIWSQQLEH